MVRYRRTSWERVETVTETSLTPYTLEFALLCHAMACYKQSRGGGVMVSYGGFQAWKAWKVGEAWEEKI